MDPVKIPDDDDDDGCGYNRRPTEVAVDGGAAASHGRRLYANSSKTGASE